MSIESERVSDERRGMPRAQVAWIVASGAGALAMVRGLPWWLSSGAAIVAAVAVGVILAGTDTRGWL